MTEFAWLSPKNSFYDKSIHWTCWTPSRKSFPIAVAIFSLMLFRLKSIHLTIGRDIRSMISLSQSSERPLSYKTIDLMAGKRDTPSTSSLNAARLNRFVRNPERSIFSSANYSVVNLKSFFLFY